MEGNVAVRGRVRNIADHRAILNVPAQRGGNVTIYAAIMQNGVLHRHANLGPYNMPTYSHVLVTAEDQMDADQMIYISIWDNVSFH